MVAVDAEALAGLHAVLVDDPQRAPLDVARIVVVGERKAVPGIQRAVVGVAAFVCGAQGDPALAPSLLRRANRASKL